MMANRYVVDIGNDDDSPNISDLPSAPPLELPVISENAEYPRPRGDYIHGCYIITLSLISLCSIGFAGYIFCDYAKK